MPVSKPASSRKRGSFPFLVAAGVVALDQASKWLAVQLLTPQVSFPIFAGIFHFTLIYNTGVAFGLFRGMGLPLVMVSCAVLLFIFWTAGKGKRRLGGAELLALGLILGGAVGNLIDRIRVGAVIDFLDFRIWPVFNLADSCITVGALLLVFCLSSSRKRGSSP